MPRSLNCLSTPAAQLAHTNGCRASAMLSCRMSRCKLPAGKSDKRRMKPSTKRRSSRRGTEFAGPAKAFLQTL